MDQLHRGAEVSIATVLAGGGELGARMRALDWKTTPIGPVEGWPQSLRTAVSICLNSRFPILIWWGRELVMLYNDAYRPILGLTKHPRALGQTGQECWPEIWHIIGPMLHGVLDDDQATRSDDQLLLLDRNGYLEECFFTFSYSPIQDETGGIGGVFCAVSETTKRVLGERRLRMFERFHQIAGARGRSIEGSGIGLALVQELARLHGGTVDVMSELDRGSTFTVSIPRGHAHLPADRIQGAPGRAATHSSGGAFVAEALQWLSEPPNAVAEPVAHLTAAAAASNVAPEAAPRPLVLVADDNADMRQFLQRLLAREYRVIAVADGAAALAAARAQPPDLVLADVMMPQLDGFGLLTALRAEPRTQTLPIMLLSARADEAARLAGLEAGADDYLIKPFGARELLARIDARLQLAQLRRETTRALRENEARLRLALQAAQMVAWEWDTRQNRITASATFEQIYGLPVIRMAEEGFQLVHPDDFAQRQAAVEQVVAHGGAYHSEFRITRPDNGQTVWLEEWGFASVDATGVVQKLIGVAMEISARKRAEERLRRLQEVTAGFAAAQTLAQVRRVILSDVASALGADAGGLRRVMATGLVVDEYEVGPNTSAEELSRYGYVPMQARHPASEAARSGTAVFIEDAHAIIRRYPDLADAVTRQKIQAIAHLPLKRGEEVFSVLSLTFAEPRSWDKAEQTFALTLASRAAVSYERARLFAAEQRRSLERDRAVRRLEKLLDLTDRLGALSDPTEMARVLVEEGSEMYGPVAGGVSLLHDDGNLVIAAMHGYPPEFIERLRGTLVLRDSPMDDAVRLGQPVWLNSLDEMTQRYPHLAPLQEGLGFAATVTLPLRSGGRVLGALGFRYAPDVVPDAEERHFVTLLAERLANAIDRSQLLGAERAARRRLEETSAVLEQALLAARMVAWDTVEGQLTLSANTAALLGADVVLARTPLEGTANIHPDDLEAKLASFRQALEHGSDYHAIYRFRNRDRGDWLWLEDHGRATYVGGRAVGISGVTQDISERKQAETDTHFLAELSEQIRLAEDMDALIWAVSLSDTYAAWRSYDAPTDGSGVYAVVCATNRPLRLTQAELEAHPGWRGFGRAAAEHLPMRGWLAVPLTTPDGRNIGLIQLSDKAAGEFSAADEAVLAQLAQLASVAIENARLYTATQDAVRVRNQFLSIAAHELKTPLTALLGYSQTLLRRVAREASIGERDQRLLRQTTEQALRLNRLIDALLDVGRIETGRLSIERQPVDLSDLLGRVVETVQTTLERHTLELTGAAEPQIIIGDELRLEQVTQNLLSNAVKYSPAGGAIRVTLTRQSATIEIAVQDQGLGIPQAAIPQLFQRFYRVDGAEARYISGMGIGLYVVKEIVGLHGGTVAVESAEGIGSTFTISLPLARDGELA